MAGEQNVVVLVSGRGSNLQALIDSFGPESDPRRRGPVRMAAVLSNESQAPALERARRAGIPAEALEHRSFPSRADFDAALMERVDRYHPALVVLAGFMRILSTPFVRHYAGRLINIHPSLLPSFPGLDTHRRALEAGAREHGATVHFVTEGVDEGPIILQARVPVLEDDSADTLAARVLAEEHRILPQAVWWFVHGRLRVEGPAVLLDGDAARERRRASDF